MHTTTKVLNVTVVLYIPYDMKLSYYIIVYYIYYTYTYYLASIIWM